MRNYSAFIRGIVVSLLNEKERILCDRIIILLRKKLTCLKGNKVSVISVNY